MALVSVVVPVYNTAQYLNRCLYSILNQSFYNWECIIVDDGSTDGSLDICRKFASIDSRFTIIHQQNRGIGATRQKGLENATGEYVIYIDSDDWVGPNMLRDMYNHAINNNADIVIADYYINSKNSEKYIIQRPSSLQYNRVLEELFYHLIASTWNKLIKNVKNVKFIEGLNYCEDLLFLCKYITINKPSISYIPKAYYHYNVTNPISIIASGSQGKLQTQYIKFIEELEIQEWSENHTLILKLAYTNVIYNLLRNNDYDTTLIKKFLKHLSMTDILLYSPFTTTKKIIICSAKLLPRTTQFFISYIIKFRERKRRRNGYAS